MLSTLSLKNTYEEQGYVVAHQLFTSDEVAALREHSMQLRAQGSHPGLPIGTIAYQCGFQSRYHFSRRIRQETGFTPQEVRRRFWQQNTQEAGNH